MNRLLTGIALVFPLFMPASLQAGEASQPDLRIENVQILDPSREEFGAETGVVVIRGGAVTYAGPSNHMPATGNSRVVDGQGMTVLPGLVDMHVHVWDQASLGAYLASGITTVRNMSGMPFHLELARNIEAGAIAGPNLVTSGPILNSAGPNQQINHQIVETAAEARAAVAQQQATGYTRLKVYSNLTREAYEAIADEARLRGLRVTGHTPEGRRQPGMPQERAFPIGFDEILDEGFETIEHVESVVWHGLRNRRDPQAARELVKRIAASGVTVTPTLVAHRNLVRVAETDGAYARREGTEKLNPVEQQTEVEHIAAWAMRDPGGEMAAAEFYLTFTRMLHDAGVPLVTGSDAGIFTNIPGESLHDEFDLLAEAGLTPGQIIPMATRNAARALGLEGESGCLSSGCAADLVLYACDPLADISCLRHPAAMVRAGRWLPREELDRFDASAAEHNPERTIANLVDGMAAQGTPIDPEMLDQ